MNDATLEKIWNQLDADYYALENLIEIFHRAALWSQCNTDARDVDWILVIDMLTEAITRLEHGASKVTDIAEQGKDDALLSAGHTLRVEISKIKDLISIFLAASVNDAERESPQLSWAAGFEAIFNMMSGIERPKDAVWAACAPKLNQPKS